MAIERDSKALEQRVGARELRPRYNLLTLREREVMASVTQGMLNKHVAIELGAREITVRIQRGRSRAKWKLGRWPTW
jgi:FixJ family two-component response regulator